MTTPDADYEDSREYEEVPYDDELEELCKPEPLSFPDAYAPAAMKPVELVVPGHSDAFKVIEKVQDSRFPAKRVAKSAAALANAFKTIAKK